MSRQRPERIWLDGLGYLLRGIERNPKISIEEACIEEVLSYLSRVLKRGFQGGETPKMNGIKITIKASIQRAC